MQESHYLHWTDLSGHQRMVLKKFKSTHVSVSSWSWPSCQSDPYVFVLVPPLGPSCTNKEERPYITMLSCWASQEEVDTDSSNEEEVTEVTPTVSGADGPVERDPASNPSSNTNKYEYSTTVTTTTHISICNTASSIAANTTVISVCFSASHWVLQVVWSPLGRLRHLLANLAHQERFWNRRSQGTF